MEIIPAILEKEWAAVAEKLGALSGKAQWVQIDVADGDFAGPPTWQKPDDLWSLEYNFSIELHLMIARPWEHINEWLRSGADRFVVHVEPFLERPEDMEHLDAVINTVLVAGKEVGVAINPRTPWECLERYIEAVEHVLFLGVIPGKSGQAFQGEVLEKIRTLREAYPDVTIAVDGGVSDATAGRIAQAGADRLVSSSFIFSFDDPIDGIEALREAAEQK